MTSVPHPPASSTDPTGRDSGAGPAPGDGSALYTRIGRKLKQDIVSGVYAQGAYLPSSGELGKLYGANKNTVLRALRMLRAEGLIDFGRGRGAVVVHSAHKVGLAEISEQLRRVVNLADVSGISRAAVVAAIQRIPPSRGPRTAGASPAAAARRGGSGHTAFRPHGRGAA
ncbi:GntR family transcriptional regulator [Streptomyces fodineus]|uniref:GntR family transcriptional regulator n=1 Tax=Streptomyces fodineus TaxID=1904616 RepID=UPI0009A0B3C2|nr:winged helix-turn-helix domain-containing protein [Streptomyces fodineus]